MILGFTGTRKGLTSRQRQALLDWLADHEDEITKVLHGCCRGADHDFAEFCVHLIPQPFQVGYPSTLKGWTSRAALRCCDASFVPLPPRICNRQIVDNCDRLLVCPEGPETLRSGTWATVRYARTLGRDLVFFWPAGHVTYEGVVKEKDA